MERLQYFERFDFTEPGDRLLLELLDSAHHFTTTEADWERSRSRKVRMRAFWAATHSLILLYAFLLVFLTDATACLAFAVTFVMAPFISGNLNEIKKARQASFKEEPYDSRAQFFVDLREEINRWNAELPVLNSIVHAVQTHDVPYGLVAARLKAAKEQYTAINKRLRLARYEATLGKMGSCRSTVELAPEKLLAEFVENDEIMRGLFMVVEPENEPLPLVDETPPSLIPLDPSRRRNRQSE